MAALKGRGGNTEPLNDYELEDRWWQSGDSSIGRPFVGGAIHRQTGLRVVIKQWPRKSAATDEILREIWRDEVRQLNRLKSLPKAAEHLTVLRDSFEDKRAFTLVLECGERLPLSYHANAAQTRAWYSTSRTVNGRMRLWRETARLAKAVGILHGQGLLHRNIDASAVMTEGGAEPDFLLTGFEWSMRLSGKGQSRRRADQSVLSFYEDWRALGQLVAWLLKIPSISTSGDYRADPNANTDFLIAPERDLLRLLVAADPLIRLDAEVVEDQIARILSALEQQRVGAEARLLLALPLDPLGQISRTIREASGNSVALDDFDAQRRFLADALQDGTSLVRLKTRPGFDTRYKISGPTITLEVRPYSLTRGGEATWSIAVCSGIVRERPAFGEIDESISLDNLEIEIIDLNEARVKAPRVQGRVTSWPNLFANIPTSSTLVAMENRIFSALIVLQIADTIGRVLQIWPVRRKNIERDGLTSTMLLEGRQDKALGDLATAFDLKPPAARLYAGVMNETLQVDGEWQVSEDLAVGRVRGSTTTWRFNEGSEVEGRHIYRFVSNSVRQGVDVGSDLYLQIGGAGDDALLERRMAALKALRDHKDVLAMLADPAGDVRMSRDDPEALASVLPELDPAKAEALKQAWERVPLYLLQGPPGVGKTRLVRALTKARLNAAPTDRLLLTAQSHAAIDHLLEEVAEAEASLPEHIRNQIFAIRCRSRSDESKTDWDRERQAGRIASNLASSELYKNANPSIKRKIKSLERKYAKEISSEDLDSGAAEKGIDRSFESLLLRSANLIFASTNSADLARLLEEGGQFDWAIVEEAGKATGLELLTSLMLSHRRMMIGDHLQLPAFDAESLTKILSDPSRLKAGLNSVHHVIAPLFRKMDMEEALDWVAEKLDQRLCSEAIRLLTLFESLIVPNVIDLVGRSSPSIGSQLLIQHRMHPVLAELVSRTFYSGKLETDRAAREKYESEEPPVYSLDPKKLPDAPLLWVNVPYVQTTPNMKIPEKRPNWRNELEAQAAVDVLNLLEPRSASRPSLAILSPYSRQVRLLKEKVMSSSAAKKLDMFRYKTEDGHFSTVDSFQGNEADIVIISLVRNNARTGEAALGFLADQRRMNVLLSRAKWRMILIGSMGHLDAAMPAGRPLPATSPLAFIERLLSLCSDTSPGKLIGVQSVNLQDLKGEK